MMRKLAVCVLVGCFVARAAGAATIPAEFVVEVQPLKATAVATDTVTASLYLDDTCTTPVATTGPVALEDVEMTERLKPFNAKAASSKAPKTVRLHFSFTATPAAGDRFVSVTSSAAGAIVGYPSACQLQEPSDAVEVICQQLGALPNCNLTATIASVANASVQLFDVVNIGPGGNFGDRSATTATCAAAAVSQGLSCDSTIALIAYSGGDDIAGMPSMHGVPSGRIVVASTNEKVADDWADFLSGTWNTCLGSTCNPPGPVPGGLTGDLFLTGANNDGTWSGSNCSDWASTSGTFSAAEGTCYGQAGGGCLSGATLGSSSCDNALCCGVTQGSMLCLCY